MRTIGGIAGLSIPCGSIAVCSVIAVCGAVAAAPGRAHIAVRADAGRDKISRNIYGHFSEHLGGCIYGGIWVGEESPIPNVRGIRKDVVDALRAIRIPVLRWPGGCFADEYHWKDGIGPRVERPTMINTHWGGVTETNHFGTHEFLDLCEQLGCEPYVCGNVGSGTVEEMQDWIEYMTSDGKSPMADLRRKNGRDAPWKVKYFGIGNENWGCGGNMRPEYYADVYRRFQTYVRNFGGNRVFKIACGPYGDNVQWTEVLMREAGRFMAGLAPHYYCGSGKESRSATRFGEVDWFAQLQRALRIDGILVEHERVMDKYDPQGRVAIIFDEWGAWHEVEPGTNPGFLFQQNSLRDAMVAALTLNIFNNHAKRVKMSNIAQTVNVLQAMILTREAEMILTPTYFVYEMYTVHHDATLLPAEIACDPYRFEKDEIPAVNASASRDDAGRIHISLVNIHPHEPMAIDARISGAKASRVRGKLLTADAMTAHNSFEKPDVVKPIPFDGATVTDDGIRATLPARSVVVLEIE
ncbi:MAG: alpha-N-arabinofuranosidase [Planctomycetes bacterium]|nr:alpha-N-arabinofuranosidase [Planctomycetota bacterium]